MPDIIPLPELALRLRRVRERLPQSVLTPLELIALTQAADVIERLHKKAASDSGEPEYHGEFI